MTDFERSIIDMYGPTVSSTWRDDIADPEDIDRHLDYFEHKSKEPQLSNAFNRIDDTEFGRFVSQQLKQRSLLTKHPTLFNLSADVLWDLIYAGCINDDKLSMEVANEISIYATILAMKLKHNNAEDV